MSNVAIKVENLSKLYQLGSVSTGTLSNDLTRWWAKVRGQEDPFAQVAIANDRSKKTNSEYVWSLKDINFEINKGDAVGIVGKNGAGKSTLLKVLSRVTGPTTGSIKIKGRVASLLEVGTGFHGDLSGRENIYMNGAILGMSRYEITSKMEEIVEFSGVAGYIDTPVKRYSSGMYVRLAFAVAAHLEPEILVVDEVLAVGDAEFQKKCLGKMQDVNSQDGRTVLFVSHNMAALQNLCSKSILLANGGLVMQGTTEEVINRYLKDSNKDQNALGDLVNHPGRSASKAPNPCFKRILFKNGQGETQSTFQLGETVRIELAFREDIKPMNNVAIKVSIDTISGHRIMILHTDRLVKDTIDLQPGTTVSCDLVDLRLMPGIYKIKLALYQGPGSAAVRQDVIDDAASFEIVAADIYGTGKLTFDSNSGILAPNAVWNV